MKQDDKFHRHDGKSRPINKATMDAPQEEFVEPESRPSESATEAPPAKQSSQEGSADR
jgi:hypothetical protein